MQMDVGTTEEVVYLFDPDDMAASQRYGGLGKLRELDALTYWMFANRSQAFQWEKKQ
jgi:hypothetical protein